MYDLIQGASNQIPFVLVDASNNEVAGLDDTFTVTLRKDGGSFGASAGTKSELGSGWYLYTATADECDTAGFLSLRITAPGTMQQNLVYKVSNIEASVASIRGVTDEIDVSSVTHVAASMAGHLTITVGLTFNQPVSGLTIPADWEQAFWTLKEKVKDAEIASIVQLKASNPSNGSDGVIYLNASATFPSGISLASGSLVVDQAGSMINIFLEDDLTVLLNSGSNLGWDVKFIDSDGDSVGRRGTADIVLTETKTI